MTLRPGEDRSQGRGRFIRLDGRWIVLGAVLACLGVLGVAAAAGEARPWTWLGVYQVEPSFADLHNLTSAADCAEFGVDPLRDNQCDANRRPMNYPRIWLHIVPSGLDGRARVILGTIMALSVIAGFLAFVGRLRAPEGFLAALLVASPALWLLLERGNNDGWIFLLCLVAIPLLGDRRDSRRDAGVAVIVLAAALKLYPAVILFALLLSRPRDGRTWLRVLVGAALVAVYGWAIRDDLATIFLVVPQSGIHSYGANTWPLRHGHGLDLRPWFAGAAVLAFLAGVWLERTRAQVPALAEDRVGVAFLCGAAVYAGTFASGSNWAYRLAFVLLLVPQLVAWGRERGSSRSLAHAIWALAVLTAYCRLAPFPAQGLTVSPAAEGIAGLGDAASWGLALLLVAVLGAAAARGAAAGPVTQALSARSGRS